MVLRHISYLLVFIFISIGFTAQVRKPIRTIKPVKTKSRPARTDFSVGGGMGKSVLFLARNTKDKNDAFGYTALATYGSNKTVRASLEYTRYNSLNIEPTWYNIKASTIELNVNAICRSPIQGLNFYFIAGASYNVFKGYFTGDHDYLNLSLLYQKNMEVNTRWLGVNTGVGVEFKIKRITIFGTYKMRLGHSEGINDFNVQDLCYNWGVRFNLRAPSIYNLFKGTKNRYFLDAE